MKRVTIRAVAREAGVSVSTVSNVISGRFHQMTPATRERVLLAMKRLEYRPNHVARSLVTNRTATIGLIMSEVTNSLYPLVTIGAEAACREAGYSLLLASADSDEAERKAVEVMREKRVDALVLFSISYVTADNDYLVQADREGLPIVALNRHVPDDTPLSTVLFDHHLGGCQATRHLIALGHARIAHIAGPSFRLTGVQRRGGYEAALREAGFTVDTDLVMEGDYSFESGERIMTELLATQPTAVFVGGDAMALGAIRALSRAGVHVPNDLSVVAFGNPDFVRFATPSITTVDLPVAMAGRVAVELALARVREPAKSKEVRTLQPKLLVRETTAAPAGLRLPA
jgi:LacI family transcriptional regulator